MRIYRIIPLALLVVLVAGFAAAPIVTAQDDMMMVTCDADLVLNLYIAENYFDYAAIKDKLMMGDNAMMMTDTSTIDKGQYAPLFDEMMSMMDNEMMMSSSVMDEDMMTAVMDAMAMSEDDMMMGMADTGMEGDTMVAHLTPLTVADEPEACAGLRSELSHFWTSLAYAKQSMSMMDSGS